MNTSTSTLSSFDEVENKHTKKVNKMIFGMHVKKDTTLANVLALPLIFTVSTAAGAYYNM
jgi:hypothetical protein